MLCLSWSQYSTSTYNLWSYLYQHINIERSVEINQESKRIVPEWRQNTTKNSVQQISVIKVKHLKMNEPEGGFYQIQILCLFSLVVNIRNEENQSQSIYKIITTTQREKTRELFESVNHGIRLLFYSFLQGVFF